MNKKNGFILAILVPIAIALIYLISQNSSIGFISLYSIDEQIFHWSLRHMIESFLIGNLSGIFGFGFYQYGFIYFLLNAIAAAPGILSDNFAWALIAPRAVTSLFALGSLVFIYKFARIYTSDTTSVIIASFFVTMPAFWFNATWFHPDWPMTFFLIAFAYFLARDNWEFGKYFKFGVIAYGLALAFKYQALTAMPLLALYILYDFIRNPLNESFFIPARRMILSLLSAVTIFIIANPYIFHPMGWTAFSSAFYVNMKSNATNHGSSEIVSMITKINEAVGDYYLNIIFLFIFLIGTTWLTYSYFKVAERSIFSLIAINFLINFGYLMLFVNKAWQIYYLPVVVVGLLSLIYFIKDLNEGMQKLIIGFVCLTQIIIYSSSYLPILSVSRDQKAPDYTTYTVEENQALDSFLIESLQGMVDSTTKLLITPYTPFSFPDLNLEYEQVRLIFGPIHRNNVDAEAYLIGQKNYWGDLKSDEELLATFHQPNIVILRKNIPFITETDFSDYADPTAYEDAKKIVDQLYNGDIGYSVMAENELAVIFKLQ